MNLSSKWRSPSNIALVKYWGKHPNQIPANPSLSFTLKECYTETEVVLNSKVSEEEFDFEVLLDGMPEEKFKPKILKFFKSIVKEASFLREYHLSIKTRNSFPHSSGIASSASGMSALALCLLSLKKSIDGDLKVDFKQKASEWARLGSGSASRSIYPELVQWGKSSNASDSSDEYATTYKGKVHEVFKSFKDYVLLVEVGSKSVSSTAGHGLMNNHPFANQRFEQAHENLAKLETILASGDLNAFGTLIESEALTLHAMMMTSEPYFILMKPNTVQIIDLIWKFRKETNTPLFFTLDAGANVHLLFPNSIETEVENFVESELKGFLKDGRYIKDGVGTGAIEI